MAKETVEDGVCRRSRRVLIVEDNEAACRSLARLLRAHGFEVDTAYNGETAKESLASSIPLGFLLTDLGLPDLDGREIARLARERFPSVKVIVITGWDVDEQSAEWERWGVDSVLTKPVEIDALLKLLDQK